MLKFTFLSLTLAAGVFFSQNVRGGMFDIEKDFKSMVLARGFAVEEHHVRTADGYILTLHRIPRNLTAPAATYIPPQISDENLKLGAPVLLMHGIQDSSDAWVSHDSLSPAFILANAGYDVWLGNFRGNKNSKRHMTLTEFQKEFWDFGIEELALYDIPAFTDYILSKSSYQKLAYIGHSMGATSAFMALAWNSTYYSKRWSTFLALASPVYMVNITSPLFNILGKQANFYFLEQALRILNIYEINPANWLNNGFFKYVCQYLPDICKYGDQMLADNDPSVNEDVASKVYFAHFPSGTTLKQLAHFTQMSWTNKFLRYDYGTIENQIVYGQDKPPEIDITKISGVSIALFAGLTDHLATIDDSALIVQKITKAIVHFSKYNLGHLSYFIAKDMSYFTRDAMSVLSTYHPNILATPRPQLE